MQIHFESHNTHRTIVILDVREDYLWTLHVICAKLQQDALLTPLQEAFPPAQPSELISVRAH